ncbi:MAG: hypothetical protein E6J75_14960, partial [Deltaproteobacteria bacterium]
SNNPIREAFILAYEPTALTLVRVVYVFDDGSFAMNGLAPGRYLISAQTEKTFVWGVFDGETVLNAGTLVDVTAGAASGINLVLPDTAGTITGTITRSDTGQPLMGAAISVRNFRDNSPVGATSRADGTFLVRGVAPDVYKVRVSAPKFVTKFFRIGVPGGTPIFNDGSFVTVTGGGNTPGINVALDPTGGALTGTVRRQDTLAPVVAAVVGIRDATTGSSVTFIPTDANGVYKTEGLAAGNYKITVFDIAGQRDGSGNVLAARYATQWFSGQSTRENGDTVTVTPVGVTGGIDFLVSPRHGSVSGRAFLSDGTTPLGGVGISIFDQATGGFVRSAGITDKNGNYSATGLAPSTYVAQASALGFAQQFHPGVPTSATATTLTVASDLTNINFGMTHSSDITGAINYGGTQTGTLRVRLFSDAALTHQVYDSAIPSPSFIEGQPYSFTLPPPDARGLLPGTYYLAAFLDSNRNAFQDPTEASGQLGAPDTVTVAENTTAAGKNFAIAEPPATTNTPPVADPQGVIVVQGSSGNSILLTGSDAQTATANLTYTVTGGPAHGTLTTTPVNPQQRFYSPSPGFTGTDKFTFTARDRGDPDNCGTPGVACAAPLTSAPATVIIEVTPNAGITSRALSVPVIVAPGEAQTLGNVEISENATGALAVGSAIKLSLPAGMTFRAPPTVSFQVANGAVFNPPILESPSVGSVTLAHASTLGPASILVSGIKVDVPPGFLPPDVTSADLLTTIFGPNPGLLGLSQSVKNGTVVTSAAGPTLTNVSPASAALGAVGRVVVLTGANFAPDASVSFGPGVFVTNVSVGPTQIAVTLNISLETPLGVRDVTVTNVSAERSVTKTGAFVITGTTPIVTAASGPLVQGLDNQLVTITGTNFAPPTTTPPDLLVKFSGTGVTVTNVGYTSGAAIAAVVNVDAAAPLTTYNVTVTNPDGGSATGFGLVSVEATAGLAAPPSKGTPSTPPPPPSITSLLMISGPIGSSVTINGSGFSATATNNSVTFAGASGVRVAATVTAATSTALTVTVPSQATTGGVTVAVSGLLSNSATFTVTTPVLATVLPGTITTDPSAVKSVPLTLSGSRFSAGATVSFDGPAGDITPIGSPIVSPDGTTITLTVSIPPTPGQTGPRDVTVTNPGVCSPPALPGCLSSTLLGGFQIQLPPAAGFNVTLPTFADNSLYLPSVTQVSLTRLATGACDPTTKVVTPTSVALQATFVTTTGLTPPASVTFTIASSALPGTATNEDCELDPTNPTKDFSVGAASPASQTVVVSDGGGGTYQTTLYSYDWGGKVTITVTGTTPTGVTATGTLTLPVDTDGDDLPDAYEKNGVLNADQTGTN